MRIFRIHRRRDLVRARSIFLPARRRSLLRRNLILHLIGDCLLHLRSELRCRTRFRRCSQHVCRIGKIEIRGNQRIGRPQRSHLAGRLRCQRQGAHFAILSGSLSRIRSLQIHRNHVIRQPECCCRIHRIRREVRTVVAIPGRRPPTPRINHRCGPRIVSPPVVSGTPIIRRCVTVIRTSAPVVGAVAVRVRTSAHIVGALHIDSAAMAVVGTLGVTRSSAIAHHSGSMARAHDSRAAVDPAIDRHPVSLDHPNLPIAAVHRMPATLQGDGLASRRLMADNCSVRGRTAFVRVRRITLIRIRRMSFVRARLTTLVRARLSAFIGVIRSASVRSGLATLICVRRRAFIRARLATLVRVRRSAFIRPRLSAFAGAGLSTPVRVRRCAWVRVTAFICV